MKRFIATSLCLISLGLSVYTQHIQGGEDISMFEKEFFDNRIHSLSMFIDKFNSYQKDQSNDLNIYDSLALRNFVSLFYLTKIRQDESRKLETEALEFIDDVFKNQSLLFPYGKDLIAEVDLAGKYKGEDIDITVYLRKVNKDRQLYWVIESVKGVEIFLTDQKSNSEFITPNSSDMNFMSLGKNLSQSKSVTSFTRARFEPDYLTLFLFTLSEGQLTLGLTQHVSLIFTQVDGWVFRVEETHDQSLNSGWLITELAREKNKKEYLYSLGIK